MLKPIHKVRISKLLNKIECCSIGLETRPSNSPLYFKLHPRNVFFTLVKKKIIFSKRSHLPLSVLMY